MGAAPRVLVVDDEPSICEMLECWFTDEGWDVQTRSQGQDALDLLERWRADVIVLDLSVLERDAKPLLVACRQWGAWETPIVVLSGAPGLEQRASDLGVSGWLAKPFDLEELEILVRRLVVRDQAVSATDGASDGR